MAVWKFRSVYLVILLEASENIVNNIPSGFSCETIGVY